MRHYQHKDGNVDKSAPIDFLSAEQRAALTSRDGKFRVSLYKALLYVGIADAIKSGALNLEHSEKYRALDEYLIPKADWDAHRTEYLYRAQLEEFADCKATLKALDQALDAGYQETNQNLKSGKNPYLTVRANGTFHVKTPKQEEVECMSLGTFFPERKYISMQEMLATVDQATNFLDEFEHWQVKYQRAKPAKKLFLAGIIGFGCDIGHRKLAQISKQIDEGELDNTVNRNVVRKGGQLLFGLGQCIFVNRGRADILVDVDRGCGALLGLSDVTSGGKLISHHYSWGLLILTVAVLSWSA